MRGVAKGIRRAGVMPAALLVVSLGACQLADTDRPPGYSGERSPASLAPGSVGSSSSGMGGESSASTGDEEQSVQTPVVRRVSSLGFEPGSKYDRSGTVWLMSFDGSQETHEYDGQELVLSSGKMDSWLAVQPSADSSVLTGISYFPEGGLAEPFVVDRAVLDEIMGGLIRPAAVAQRGAHLVLRILRSDAQAGLAGVVPTVFGAENLAFEEGGLWTDNDEQTSSSGLVLAFNIPVAALPGQDVQVVLTGAHDAEFVIRLAESSVTFVTYVEL